MTQQHSALRLFDAARKTKKHTHKQNETDFVIQNSLFHLCGEGVQCSSLLIESGKNKLGPVLLSAGRAACRSHVASLLLQTASS